jgi:IPT/TIG domain
VCDSYQHPNGDWADAAISIASHEHSESMTDPFGTAWYDGVGNEDGDKCAWNFGTPLGSTTYGKYNQVIANVKYYVQQEWSNASHACALTYVPTPVISSFTPESGSSGATVTLTGANYTATKSVTFNGTSASFTVLAPNTITAKAPAGVTSGVIAVTNAYGTTKSSTSFWVPPTVTSFTSTSGKAGANITVYGTNFTGATAVSFGGVSATFKVSEAKKLVATVPVGAVTGAITVTTPGGSATSSTSFTVLH